MEAVEATERFAACVRVTDDNVALAQGALLIAAHAHPGLDPDHWLGVLDALAEDCVPRTFEGLVRHVFERHGFTGNQLDYSDPENSMLDSVLWRRTGIPITLAVVLIEVGRRAGIALEGVGMPGHFLVRDREQRDRYCDPFTGRILDVNGCRAIFEQVHGPAAEFRIQHLGSVGNRQILARMLANLERGPLGAAPAEATWMLDLHRAIPGLAPPDRVAIAERYAAIGRFDAAADEYTAAAALLGEPAAGRLRNRAREQRARTN